MLYQKLINIHKLLTSGVDIVLDPLSGADSVKGFDLLKPFGTIVHFGKYGVNYSNNIPQIHSRPRGG